MRAIRSKLWVDATTGMAAAAAAKLMRTPADRDDLRQEIVVALLARDDFDPLARGAPTYVARLATWCRNRRSRRREDLTQEGVAEPSAPQRADPTALIDMSRVQLTPKERVLLRHLVDGSTLPQPWASSRSNVSRAHQSLRRKLGGGQ